MCVVWTFLGKSRKQYANSLKLVDITVSHTLLLFFFNKGVTDFENLMAIWRHYSGQLQDGNVSVNELILHIASATTVYILD